MHIANPRRNLTSPIPQNEFPMTKSTPSPRLHKVSKAASRTSPSFPNQQSISQNKPPLIPKKAAQTTGALNGTQASRKLATTTTSPRNQVLGSRRRRLGKLLKREGMMLDMMSLCGLLQVGTGCLRFGWEKNVGGMTEERGSPGLAAEPTRCDAHVQEGATSCLLDVRSCTAIITSIQHAFAETESRSSACRLPRRYLPSRELQHGFPLLGQGYRSRRTHGPRRSKDD